MKIKMLRNPAARLGCELSEGETGDVDDDLAEKLIEMNIAELPSDTAGEGDGKSDDKPSRRSRRKNKTPEKVEGVSDSVNAAEAKPADVTADKPKTKKDKETNL